MRLRNDPKAKLILEENKDIYTTWESGDGFLNLKKMFNNSNPVYLEIGMGKGQFLIQHALNNPNINYIGIEKNTVICSKAIKKYLALGEKLKNFKLLNMDANKLPECFAPNSISKIYLNFSDPWPKARHAKNRLTNIRFLNLYKEILISEGVIEQKTDNESLYTYSLEVINENDSVLLLYTTNDLYRDIEHSQNLNNIPTEYETRFSQIKNINKIIFKFK
ncbi:MAG: tRNA (guanosine(46)-N7)-methyltransferase TrmB [Mycoplasma sp.]